MAGIDRSDLQPLGGQQASHSVRSHHGDGDLLSRVGLRDVGTRTDPVSSVSNEKIHCSVETLTKIGVQII